MIVTINTVPAAAVELIALSRLGVAEENVRRTDRKGGIEGLAESIAAEGLLQNLTGFQTETGRYRIVAGGRRLAALKMLAKAGRWSGPVPVRVLACATDAKRASLAENIMRQALHPADEFEAFAGLISEGHDLTEVARRFGTTVRHVEQRMKLAAVSPSLVKAYRAGDMTLDQLTAFAVVDDHARQLAAWTGGGGWRDLSPRGIRASLLSQHVPVTDKLARFVGLDAYEEAGGIVVRDLFSDEEAGTWLAGPELLQRLAAERMQVEVEAVAAEGWAWTEVFESFPYGGFHSFGRVYPSALPLSDEDRAELDRLIAERDALERRAQDDPSQAVVTLWQEVDAAIRQRQQASYGYAAEDMARAGCAIGLTHEGVLKVERGLVRPEEVRREKKQARAAETVAARTEGGERIAEAPCPTLPDSLVEELTAQRTAALRVEVMGRPDLALAGVVHALALPVFYPYAYRAASCFDLRAYDVGLSPRVAEAQTCPALQALDAAHEAWSQRLPGDSGEFWAWLTEQPQDTVMELLAFLASGSVNAVRQRHEGRPARLEHADQLAQSTGLDMTAWWTADAAFLARLSKPQIVAAVSEGASAELAAPLAKLPKGEAVQRAAQALEGRGWLPVPLRTEQADDPEAEGDTAPISDDDAEVHTLAA